MKRTKYSFIAIVLVLASGLFNLAIGDTIQTFVSDTTWQVFDAANNPVGFAQQVCLNATDPVTCPPGATIYGYPGGWSADLSSILGATWIWAPGISGTTLSASFDQYTFIKTFDITGPLKGYISIAVDDYAEIYINGNLVGTTGSLTSFWDAVDAKYSLHSFDIGPYLLHGANSVEIVVQNGPDVFPGYQNANYAQNPAGVVFGGVFGNAKKVAEPSTLFLIILGGMSLLWFFFKSNRSVA